MVKKGFLFTSSGIIQLSFVIVFVRKVTSIDSSMHPLLVKVVYSTDLYERYYTRADMILNSVKFV